MSLETKIDKLTVTIEKLIEVMSNQKAPEQLELPPTSAPIEPTITHDDLSEKIKILIRSDINNKVAIKALLKEYNANKVPDLLASDLYAFNEKLGAL